MDNHVVKHAAKEAAKAVKELAPLRGTKNPFLAGVLGIAFGPLGPAVYFRSAKDFFVCLAMLIACSVVGWFGPGEVAGLLFCGGYGYWRAKTSNDNLLPPVADA